MKGTDLLNYFKRFQSIDAILAAALYLGLDQNNHTLSLGLLISWICIRCAQQIWKDRNDIDWRRKGLFPIIIFGITTFQARTVIQLDDNPGGSIYVLIAASLYVGSCYAISQKMLLTRWVSAAALAINTQILIEGIRNNNIFNPGWITEINNEVFELGFGRINSLASVIAYFTILGFYGFRTDKSPFARLVHGITVITGYFLCLQSKSDMAIGMPIIAATVAFLICKKDYFKNIRPSKINFISIFIISAISSILAWTLSLRNKISPIAQNGNYWKGGEEVRIEQWVCWLKHSIFAGNNKIIHGIGYNIDQMVELCNNNNPDGGLALFISQHGLLGALSLILLAIFLIKNVLHMRKHERNSNFPSNLFACQWSEATIGTIVVVLTCNLITPSYVGSFFNASVIGIILSLGIELAPSQETKS